MNHFIKTFLLGLLAGGLSLSALLFLWSILINPALDQVNIPLFLSGGIGAITIKYIFKK